MIEQLLDDPHNFIPIAEMGREAIDVQNYIEKGNVGWQSTWHSVFGRVLALIVVVQTYFHIELTRNNLI